MEFALACRYLNDWIEASKGEDISLPQGEVCSFRREKLYSQNEISAFEGEWRCRFPIEYSYFLTHVGAIDCFRTRFSYIKFLRLEDIVEEMGLIFQGVENPFPRLIIANSFIGRGEFAGFDLQKPQDVNFTVFIPDIYPEEWLSSSSGWNRFSYWVSRLVETEGLQLHPW